MINEDSKIFVAGHNGLVGSAITRRLCAEGYHNIIARGSHELDLTSQSDVDEFFRSERPSCVFLAAAYVGGVYANQKNHSAFLYNNAQIELNVINAALMNGVADFIFIGSACIYPMDMLNVDEQTLLTGYPDISHIGYALAKVLGVEYCRLIKEEYGLNYISAIPCNLYGPNDNFNLAKCHVVPSLIRRLYEAKTADRESVCVRGSGATIREFLYVEDLVDACMLLLKRAPQEAIFNVGTGIGTSIEQLASIVRAVTGYEGAVLFDQSSSNADPPRLLDSSRIRSLGFSPRVDLLDGIALTYAYFVRALQEGFLRET